MWVGVVLEEEVANGKEALEKIVTELESDAAIFRGGEFVVREDGSMEKPSLGMILDGT